MRRKTVKSAQEPFYEISYSYRTGDSFHSEDREGTLELAWHSEDKATENLKRIEEHYKYYRRLHDHFNHEKISDKEMEAYSKQPWFVKKYDFCLVLETDTGKAFRLVAPWCGYFEELYGANVIRSNLPKFEV